MLTLRNAESSNTFGASRRGSATPFGPPTMPPSIASLASPVVLSNRDHDSRYDVGVFAMPASTAAFSNVSTPSELSRALTRGLTPVNHARSTLSRRLIKVAVMCSAAPGSLYLALATTARIASSLNFDTSRAAQNASSGVMLSKAGFGYSGRHLTGSKKSPSKRPTDFAPSQ